MTEQDSPNGSEQTEQNSDVIDLCERNIGSIACTLYWIRSLNECYIALVDRERGDATYAMVNNDEAMEAFRHPYAYNMRPLIKNHQKQV